MINGESKEAEEIYRESDLNEIKPQIEEGNKDNAIRMNKVLRYLLALLLAWICYVFINETLWLFWAMFFTWHEFLKDKMESS